MMDGQGSKQRHIDYNHVISKKHELNNGFIKSNHDSDFVFTKTIRRFIRRYYWHGIMADIS